RRGARDWIARLPRRLHSPSQPGCRIWRAISGPAHAYSKGPADRRLRRRGKPATTGARSLKNRAAWDAPDASNAERRSQGRRSSNTCIIFKRAFETKFGQESLKIRRFWEPAATKSLGKVAARLPARPAQRCLGLRGVCRLAAARDP